MESVTSSSLATKYQKKTDKEHVLDNPDTYTGSMIETEYDTYVLEEGQVISKQIKMIPGLYKLFDEGIVNCRDHQVRMAQSTDAGANQVTQIEININEEGVITMMNDGNGIDVAKHPEFNTWIPELIFGHLRTSTNYNKDEKRIVGGKNGFGFKLVLIWSEWGTVETIDHIRKLRYTQRFMNNLDIIEEPIIEKCKRKPYTKVTFKPDYKRLGVDGLSSDMMALLKRRVFDIAAVTEKKVRVKFNGEQVPVAHFQQYVDLYIGSKADTARVYEKSNERWEYAVSMAPKEEFTQVSFVNGIYTGKGGKHVEYVLNQLVRKLTAFIKKRKKVDVKSSTIKEQLMLFIRCDIENPTFDSQTKDFMNTPSSAFGTTCEISDKFVEKVAKLGVMENACALTQVKEFKAAKKTDGSKTKSIRGIPKLIDANFAGGTKSNECTIIFCEGDSAKAGIVSGLSKADRNIIGVYPMRGKLFNVRGEGPKRIMENKEISEIKQILGIETGKQYTAESAAEKLRYGKILFMTDQDLDGSHIKGLGINLFDSEWGTLLDIPGFIGFMNTPILKAKKGSQELCFYNDGEWNAWCQENDTKGWNVKYYKGLGTSTSKEFKEYFKNKKIVRFAKDGEASADAIDMAFNKKRSNDRKTWLEGYDRELYLDTNHEEVTYQQFIEREMIHFSKYDCDRSIPNLVDGLKTSLRKILFTAFKRNLKKEIKVAQFSGSVSEMSCYHHGEQSLNGAIVGMAQDFVGSNNVNLLEPKGQFGTRLQGGDDSASERYIHTNLSKVTRVIFPPADDAVLQYLDDDGTPVEPVHYAPIIPMILVNGSKGIGTGFSTEVLSYNPIDIIQYIQNKLNGDISSSTQLRPWYRGFRGTIEPVHNSNTKWLFRGCHSIHKDKEVHITELPVGTWTDDYKVYLETLIEKSVIKDYNDMSTDSAVDITVRFAPGALAQWADKPGDANGYTALEKVLKLFSVRSTTNMHMFDEREKLVKYDTPEEIIGHYMTVRMEIYMKRKAYLIQSLEHEALVLNNKARFISDILNDKLDLRRKKKEVVVALLKSEGYATIDEDDDFTYLVRLPMDSVTQENVTKLMENKKAKLGELESLKATSEQEMWLNELSALDSVIRSQKNEVL